MYCTGLILHLTKTVLHSKKLKKNIAQAAYCAVFLAILHKNYSTALKEWLDNLDVRFRLPITIQNVIEESKNMLLE